MTTDRIKEIQESTAYPSSQSVQQALLQVWNECAQQSQIEIESLTNEVERLRKERENTFTTNQIEQLQSEVYKITGKGEVMMLFNKLLGVNVG